MSHDEELDDVGRSTIVMVDTINELECSDAENESEEQGGNILVAQNVELAGFPLDLNHEGLFCIVCKKQFDLGDEESLTEHMKSHEPQMEEFSRRGVSRRKASLSVKNAYKSLIPGTKSFSEPRKKKIKQADKLKCKISMVPHSFSCKLCEMSFPTQLALNNHERQVKFCLAVQLGSLFIVNDVKIVVVWFESGSTT